MRDQDPQKGKKGLRSRARIEELILIRRVTLSPEKGRIKVRVEMKTDSAVGLEN